MLDRGHLIAAFAYLEAGGCRKPAILNTADGLSMALQAWGLALGDITPDDLTAACVAWLRKPDGQWWPVPGALLALVPARLVEVAKDSAAACDAWSRLTMAVGRHGANEAPITWEESIPLRAIPREERPRAWILSPDEAQCRAMDRGLAALGGWRAFCASDPQYHGIARKTFMDAYHATETIRRSTTETGHVLELIQGGQGMRRITG